MVPSRVCPLSDSLDSPNHGRRYSYPSFHHRMNECAIHKYIKGDWNLNQYSNMTKVFDFKRNDSEEETDDVYRKFLAFENCPDLDPQFTKQLRELTQIYRFVMEEVSAKLDQWLKLRQTNIHNLQKTLQKFSLLKRTTTWITLVSSTLGFVVGFVTMMQRLFHFDMSSKYAVLMQVVSGLRLTFPFTAYMYSKDSTEHIISEFRREKYLLREIETLFRMAKWIDKGVQELFPHGIDLELVREKAFASRGNLVEQWKLVVFKAIISINVHQDEKLMNDMKFLASVKAFVRSTAAQMWINRMKLRSHLVYMDFMVSHPKKISIYGSELFAYLAEINLCPLFLSLFFEEEFNFLWNSLPAILSALSPLDFRLIELTSTELQMVYKQFKKIRNLLADYDC